MMKRIGRGLERDKSPLLEGLFTRELTHTQSYNNMSTCWLNTIGTVPTKSQSSFGFTLHLSWCTFIKLTHAIGMNELFSYIGCNVHFPTPCVSVNKTCLFPAVENIPFFFMMLHTPILE